MPGVYAYSVDDAVGNLNVYATGVYRRYWKHDASREYEPGWAADRYFARIFAYTTLSGLLHYSVCGQQNRTSTRK